MSHESCVLARPQVKLFSAFCKRLALVVLLVSMQHYTNEHM